MCRLVPTMLIVPVCMFIWLCGVVWSSSASISKFDIIINGTYHFNGKPFITASTSSVVWIIGIGLFLYGCL